jgi:hypothetical protein
MGLQGETFRVLKEKETATFGEYRTRRLVLEAWENQEREKRRHGDGEEWEKVRKNGCCRSKARG